MLGGVPVSTAWRVLGLRIGERPPAMMEVSCEYILNKQLLTNDRGVGGGTAAWGLGVGLTTLHRKK
jgi:hypothetical protein